MRYTPSITPWLGLWGYLTQNTKFGHKWHTEVIKFVISTFSLISFSTDSHQRWLPFICPTYMLAHFGNNATNRKYVSLTIKIISKWHVPFSTELMHYTRFLVMCPYCSPPSYNCIHCSFDIPLRYSIPSWFTTRILFKISWNRYRMRSYTRWQSIFHSIQMTQMYMLNCYTSEKLYAQRTHVNDMSTLYILMVSTHVVRPYMT